MSKRPSFREAIEQRAEIRAARPKPSGVQVNFLLSVRLDGMPRPVAVARELMALGLPLRKAHTAIDRLAAGDRHAVTAVVEGPIDVPISRLAKLGVFAAPLLRPDVSARDVRETFGLSQAEFATHFGLEVRTIQNWEQGRYRLDPSTKLLLAIIRERPDIVEHVLTSGHFPEQPMPGKTEDRTA